MLLPRTTGETLRAIWTGSSGATARCFPSPMSRCRSSCRRAAAPSWPSPTSRTACGPSRCCASTMRCWKRARTRCGGSRRWWPAGRRRRRCSPRSPGRSAQSSALPLVAVWRYEPTGRGTVIGAWSEPPDPLAGRHPLAARRTAICAQVRETGRPRGSTTSPTSTGRSPTPRGDQDPLGGRRPDHRRRRLWGVMAAAATQGEPPPGPDRGAARRFTELVATAISNTASRAGARPARRGAGRAAARGDAGRARRPAGRGLRRGRARRSAGCWCRRDAHGALRGRRHGDGRRRLERPRRSPAGRQHESAPRREHRGDRVADRPGRPDRRLCASVRAARRVGPRSWASRSSVGDPDHRRGTPLGRAVAASRARRAAPGRTRSRASQTSPSWSPRRSRTSRRGPTSRRHGRGSWRRPTRSAGAWSATCTTEPSSGWSTRSSR